MKTKFINQLPLEVQKQITFDLVVSFASPKLKPLEVKSLVEDALNSRLCDLEDTIDINKYLGGKNK